MFSVLCGSIADVPFRGTSEGAAAGSAAVVSIESASGGVWASAPCNITSLPTDVIGGVGATATLTLLGRTALADSLQRATLNVPSFWYQSGLRQLIRFELLCGGGGDGTDCAGCDASVIGVSRSGCHIALDGVAVKRGVGGGVCWAPCGDTTSGALRWGCVVG